MLSYPIHPEDAGSEEAIVRWTEHFPQAFQGIRACVTGGAGFIGSHLVDALVELGAHVVVLDDLTTGFESNLPTSRERITFRHESILNPDRWAGAMDGCQFVFHLAAMGSVPRSIVEPFRCIDVNVKGTMNVLTAAQQAGVRRVIFSGSSSAYGAAPGAATKAETMPPLPRSPYAASKLAGEHLMRAWSASYGLDTAVLRYFNIFGPRQNGASAYAAAVAAFADAMTSGHAGTIYGDGSQTRDFTYVSNAVYANLLAATHGRPVGGEVFNVATGHAPSILELHEQMASAFGLRGSFAQPTFKPERRGDVAWSHADISRAREHLGYRPLVSFQKGLNATVKWYQDRAKAAARAAA